MAFRLLELEFFRFFAVFRLPGRPQQSLFRHFHLLARFTRLQCFPGRIQRPRLRFIFVPKRRFGCKSRRRARFNQRRSSSRTQRRKFPQNSGLFRRTGRHSSRRLFASRHARSSDCSNVNSNLVKRRASFSSAEQRSEFKLLSSGAGLVQDLAFVAGQAEMEECCELGPNSLVCSENENQQQETNKNGRFSFRYSFSSQNTNSDQNPNELLTRVIARLPTNQKQQLRDFNLEMPCFGFEC